MHFFFYFFYGNGIFLFVSVCDEVASPKAGLFPQPFLLFLRVPIIVKGTTYQVSCVNCHCFTASKEMFVFQQVPLCVGKHTQMLDQVVHNGFVTVPVCRTIGAAKSLNRWH